MIPGSFRCLHEHRSSTVTPSTHILIPPGKTGFLSTAMILKEKDDVAPRLAELERILSLSTLTKAQREEIEEELWLIRAGAKGEKEAAHPIDFGWKNGTRSAVRLKKGRSSDMPFNILESTPFTIQ